ncbi:MAG: hypothetical protein ACLRSW_05385 [Christensenellaceae bacterium]
MQKSRCGGFGGRAEMGMILLKSACPKAMTISPTKRAERGMAISRSAEGLQIFRE